MMMVHYKKTQISDQGIFRSLHAQLGHGNDGIPAVAHVSNVLFSELGQLSGGKLSSFSHDLAAVSGGKPWKTHSLAQGGGMFDISASGLATDLLQGAGRYIGQSIRSGALTGGDPLRGGSGRASHGQVLGDLAGMVMRSVGRDI